MLTQKTVALILIHDITQMAFVQSVCPVLCALPGVSCDHSGHLLLQLSPNSYR